MIDKYVIGTVTSVIGPCGDAESNINESPGFK